MTLPRRAAIRIAAFIQHRSSPSSREWADALQSELPFIQNDWYALTWSLSGLRIIFQRVPQPLPTREEISRAAQKYAEVHRLAMNKTWLSRSMSSLFYLVWALIQLALLFHHHHRFPAASLRIAGLLLISIAQHLRNPRAPGSRPR